MHQAGGKVLYEFLRASGLCVWGDGDVLQVSASARSTVVVTRGLDRGPGLPMVNEVYQWGHGSHMPSRVNFNAVNEGGSPYRWQTHDSRVNVTEVAAAKYHNVALSSVGQVFTWGFGADNLGERLPRVMREPRSERACSGSEVVCMDLDGLGCRTGAEGETAGYVHQGGDLLAQPFRCFCWPCWSLGREVAPIVCSLRRATEGCRLAPWGL